MAPVDPQKIKAAYAAALKLQEAGKDDDALKAFGQIVEANPNIAEVHFQIARIFLKNDRLAKALRHAKAAAQLRPNVPDIWKLWAEIVASISGKAEVREFTEALAKSPLEKRLKGNLSTAVQLSGKSRILIGDVPEGEMRKVLEAVNAARYRDAEQMARALLRHHPKAAPLHDVIGVSALLTGRAEEARDSLETALRIDPRFAKARVNYANTLRRLARAPEAIAEANKALRIAPGMADALIARAEAMKEIGRTPEAIEDLERAIELQPKNGYAEFVLGKYLLEERRLEEAVEHVERAMKKGSDPVSALLLRGLIRSDLGDEEAALADFETAIRKAPENALAHRRASELLQTLGRFDEAREAFLESIRHDPTNGETYRIYLTSEKLSPDDPLVADMKTHFADQGLSDFRRANFGFALSKVMEDAKDYDHVFTYLHPANELMRKAQPFDIEKRLTQERDLLDSYGRVDWPALKINGTTDCAPIFVTGMPRSGTTLVEQIIASHSTVEGAGEIGTATRLAVRMMTNDDKKIIPADRLPEEAFRQFGMDYAAETERFFPGVPHITDKSIQTFNHIGLVKAAMPKARIVVVRRDPRDNLLSIYKNVFPEGGHLYAYNLTDLARMYHQFVAFLDFWREAAPGSFYEISYEELVSNPEEESRKLIDACGLEWEDACLDFHKNDRRVKTLSLYQVRQPMYKSSTKAWQRYGDALDELLEALGPDYADAAE